MAVLLKLYCTVSFSAAPKPKIKADVFFEEQVSPTRTIYADVGFDAEFGAIINGGISPTGGTEVLSTHGRPCVLRLWFYDAFGEQAYEVVPQHAIHNFELTSTLEEGTTWSITLEDIWEFRETTWMAPPFGNRGMSIDGGYLSGNTYIYVRLMTNGIVNSSDRSFGREGEDLVTLSGVGAEGRYDCLKVSYRFPAGHGLNAAQQIRYICQEAGIPHQISTGWLTPRYKPLQLRDDNALQVIKDLADSINMAVVFNRQGYLTLRPILGYHRVSHVLTEHTVISGGISFRAEGNVFTRITITGTSQPTGDACGIVTKETVVDTYDDYHIPQWAYFMHRSDGDLDTVAVHSANRSARRELVKKVIVTQEHACDTLVSERVQTYEGYNPPTARYKLDGTAGLMDYVGGGYIFDSNAAKDDNAPTYYWKRFRFVKTSDVLTVYNFTDKILDGSKWIADTPIGSLLATEVSHGGWRQRKAALQGPRAVGDPWDTTLFINNTYLLGTGEGVYDQTAYWCCSHGKYYSGNSPIPSNQMLKYDVVVYDVSDKGYVLSEKKSEAMDYIWPGYKYRYHSGVESSETHEGANSFPGGSYVLDVRRWLSTPGIWYGLRPQKEGHTVYVASAAGTTHKKIASWHTFDTRAGGSVIEDQDGYLPAAEFRYDLLPDDSVYHLDEDGEYRAVASPVKSQDFKAEFIMQCAECWRHVRCDTAESNDLIETEEEAEAMGRRILMEGSAIEASLPLYFDVTKYPGQKVHAMLVNQRMTSGHGVNHDVTVKAVSHTKSGKDSPLLTAIEGKIYTCG